MCSKEQGYYQSQFEISDSAAQDDRLSYGCRGLLCWLKFDRPDLIEATNEKIIEESRAVRSKVKRGNGRKALVGYLREARSLGYLPKSLGTAGTTRNQHGKPGVVYLFRDGDRYKIGSSKQFLTRAKDVSNLIGRPLEIVKVIETSDMGKLEDFFHNKYDHLNDGGEWFLLTEKEVNEIKNFEAVQ